MGSVQFAWCSLKINWPGYTSSQTTINSRQVVNVKQELFKTVLTQASSENNNASKPKVLEKDQLRSWPNFSTFEVNFSVYK